MKKKILVLASAVALSLVFASALLAHVRATEISDIIDGARPKSDCASQIKNSEGNRVLICLPGAGCDWADGSVVKWGGKC